MEDFGLPPPVLDRLRSVFYQHAGVEKAIIYGSRAKGTYREGSDIDLALAGTVPFTEYLMILQELDDLNLPWLIDTSFLSDMDNGELIEHIERCGKLLYAKSDESCLKKNC